MPTARALWVLVCMMPLLPESQGYPGPGCGSDPDVSSTSSPPLLPPWPPTYNMTLSTVVMPCNYTGLFDTSFSSRFGLVDYDWSNSKLQWANSQPMDPEERLIQQATLSHEMNPSSKTFIYRNLVHADNWMTTVREKLDDPAYSGFFVKFKPGGSLPNNTWHVPACDTNYNPPKCSSYYHDQVNTPQHNPHSSHPEVNGECAPQPCDCGKHPCGEYVYDYRNGSMLQDFIVNEVVAGKMGLGNPVVRGFYTDDTWSDVNCSTTQPVGTCGPTEMDPYAVVDMGLEPTDVSAITQGWQRTMVAAQQKMLSMKGYTWQLLNCPFAPNLTHTCQQAPETAPGRDRCNPHTGTTQHGGSADCTTWMRRHCGPADSPQSVFHRMALFFGFTRYAHHGDLDPSGHLPALLQDLATFLLVRGPFAWIGWGWVGCGMQYARPEMLDMDFGDPIGDCHEVGNTEVFTRPWSRANVSLDCKHFIGSIKMTAGPLKGSVFT